MFNSLYFLHMLIRKGLLSKDIGQGDLTVIIDSNDIPLSIILLV